ncbi:uncharacterized protein LOC125788972 [Astyanax mexicanus]|uniref:uncharacterized protein LOC125788972 n=1 Tax=Astyanax mexicanus TaxID=7994 RepID=UPI0020CAB4A2|nr:uncharacterized protein LOC125788972 [Astyanax mexicanus]
MYCDLFNLNRSIPWIQNRSNELPALNNIIQSLHDSSREKEIKDHIKDKRLLKYGQFAFYFFRKKGGSFIQCSDVFYPKHKIHSEDFIINEINELINNNKIYKDSELWIYTVNSPCTVRSTNPPCMIQLTHLSLKLYSIYKIKMFVVFKKPFIPNFLRKNLPFPSSRTASTQSENNNNPDTSNRIFVDSINSSTFLMEDLGNLVKAGCSTKNFEAFKKILLKYSKEKNKKCGVWSRNSQYTFEDFEDIGSELSEKVENEKRKEFLDWWSDNLEKSYNNIYINVLHYIYRKALQLFIYDLQKLFQQLFDNNDFPVDFYELPDKKKE